MNWKQFLKEKQGPFLIPPSFNLATVKGKSNQIFTIKLSKPSTSWVWVSHAGNIERKALYHEIIEELNRYPSILCSLIRASSNNLIVGTKKGPLVVRCSPCSNSLIPFTRIRAAVLGTVLVFKNFDYRDSNPWYIEKAISILNGENLPDNIPNYLCDEQKIAFSILLEEEKIRRIPPTETRIKNIIKGEGANLLSMKETSRGYSISFNYKGTRRDVEIREDLMLISSGMCLSGRDKSFSLESFFSILYNRGKYDWQDDGLYM